MLCNSLRRSKPQFTSEQVFWKRNKFTMHKISKLLRRRVEQRRGKPFTVTWTSFCEARQLSGLSKEAKLHKMGTESHFDYMHSGGDCAHSKSFNWNTFGTTVTKCFLGFLVTKAGVVVPELFPTTADWPAHHVVTWQQTLAQYPARHARGFWKLQVSHIRWRSLSRFFRSKRGKFLYSAVLPTTPWAVRRSTWRSPDVRVPLSFTLRRGVNHLTATISHGRLTATRPCRKWDYSTEN